MLNDVNALKKALSDEQSHYSRAPSDTTSKLRIDWLNSQISTLTGTPNNEIGTLSTSSSTQTASTQGEKTYTRKDT